MIIIPIIKTNIIAFDCNTGPSDIIIHDENGFLVKNQDVKELEKYLLKAINLEDNTYDLFCKNSRNSSLRFSIDKIIIKWKKII